MRLTQCVARAMLEREYCSVVPRSMNSLAAVDAGECADGRHPFRVLAERCDRWYRALLEGATVQEMQHRTGARNRDQAQQYVWIRGQAAVTAETDSLAAWFGRPQ